MQIETKQTADLIPYASNSRTHSDDQVAQIASSIKEFGFNNPVLLDGDNGIIAGHGRLMAAKKLGLKEVPTIELSHMTDNQRKAYVIADNKLALNAGWDMEMLTLEMGDLKDQDFDLTLLGFDEGELANIFVEETEGLTDPDEVPELPDEPTTKEGDVWILGKHRLMCGDSTSIDAVDKLMDGAKIDCVYTDPPYGISIVQGNKVGGGGAFGGKKNEKADKSNVVESSNFAPVANDESIDVAVGAISLISTLSADVEIIWGGNYYASYLANSPCWIVWDKKNTGNFADCELAWTNQTTAVRKFEHMWNGMVKASEHGQKRVHPTQKPVALAEWCIDSYAEDCGTVLDLFGGSGSTLIACETRSKLCLMMELTPSYCDVIIKRWEDFTGNKATLEANSSQSLEAAE
jgi:DNA modification methylase|tara:strand:+ start:60 stop:1274 length:1215 start_codon:yes stop_codon:yes gene_type:complete